MSMRSARRTSSQRPAIDGARSRCPGGKSAARSEIRWLGTSATVLAQSQSGKGHFYPGQVAVRIEQTGQLFSRESLAHPLVVRQVGVQIAVAGPDFAGRGLDQVVRLAAGHATLDQGQQHLARID